jgi:hypothetical protein
MVVLFLKSGDLGTTGGNKECNDFGRKAERTERKIGI